jgi:hypothetical protein
MQCIVRNLTLFILPLEVLVILAQPERRIGDQIAGTKLVKYNRLTNNKPERSVKKYILPFLSSYAIFVALAFGLTKISFNNPAVPFVAASYNETKTRELEKLLADKFGQYYTTSVKYYDSVQNKKFGYLSIICTFNEAAGGPVLTGQELEDQTMSSVYSLFPEDQVYGKIQFVSRGTNSITVWNRSFGVRFIGDAE